MAYTSAPEVQTYSSQRVPLVWDFQVNNVASNTIVAGLINLLPFKLNEEEFAETRAAIRGTTILASGAVVRGMHVWEKVPGTTVYYFVVINTSVYTSTDATTWTAVDTLLTNVTTPVRFTEYIDDTNTKKLILVDGVEGYIYTSNAAGTKITDADFPTPHVPFPIFLDGYLFLAKANTGDIYNSDLNDPSSWTAGSFISSEVYPDDIQALIKINNYILAVGVHGSEFFYDAANTTASPLARYEGGLLPFGTNMPNSIASNNSLAMFLGNSRDGELSFFTISGLQFQPVPAISVIRSFIQNDSSRFSNAKMRAFLFRQNGELHYALNGNGDTTGTNTCYCTAYSFSQKKWCLFRGTGTSSSSYPVYFSNPGISGTGYTYIAGHIDGRGFFGKLDTGDDQDTYTGGTTEYTIAQTIYVPPQDFGTLNRKFMYRIGLKQSYGSSRPYISWNDNFGQVYTTPRRFAGGLSATNPNEDAGYPFITQCGSFRLRSFLLQTEYVTPEVISGRFYYLECDINKGQQ